MTPVYMLSIVFLISITTSIIYETEASPQKICKPCGNTWACTAPGEICPWGEWYNHCNHRLCANGPGERCGGIMHFHGKCGEGMLCHDDDRCHGCSLTTMDCFNGETISRLIAD